MQQLYAVMICVPVLLPAALTAKFIVAKVPFFKPTESYLFNETVTMKRRDLRGGGQTCEMQPVEGGVRVEIRWPEPAAGVAL